MDIIRVFFNFRFFSRESQSQQKLPKKATHFTIQFRSKNLIIWTSTHLTLKIICCCNTAKNLSEFTKNFPANMFLFGVRKNHLHSTVCWCPKLHYWSTLKTNVRLFLHISVRKDVVRFSLIGGWVGGKLNNFIKGARFLGLVKCVTIFHFNWNFCKFNYFSAFWYFYI